MLEYHLKILEPWQIDRIRGLRDENKPKQPELRINIYDPRPEVEEKKPNTGYERGSVYIDYRI
ncbi:MAG: hypothetical protein Q8Q35_00050 [Nanoarchaeota archaeon]|nr:hypothetical protein [Nanoarchaeota archaeon]